MVLRARAREVQVEGVGGAISGAGDGAGAERQPDIVLGRYRRGAVFKRGLIGGREIERAGLQICERRRIHGAAAVHFDVYHDIGRIQAGKRADVGGRDRDSELRGAAGRILEPEVFFGGSTAGGKVAKVKAGSAGRKGVAVTGNL